MTITQNLATLLKRPISDEDRRRAVTLILDWTGCAVAGRYESAGEKVAMSFANEVGHCTRIGSSGSSPQMAAFHNGCLGNVLEMDDVDKRAVLHAGPIVIPAALAMAQHFNMTAAHFLDAVVIGYEATIRIGRAVGAGHYAYWHNTATCGIFGAAAAASYLAPSLKSEEEEMVSALGLAGTQASGFWQTRHEADSLAKQLHAGHAAHAGVQSALLAAQGFQGPRSILEGEQGFFAAMCPDGVVEDVLQDYGDQWLIHDTSIKPYPACRHAHAAIDAAKQVKDWDGTSDIIIETYSDAIKFCNKPEPVTTMEAKFSLQHSVALVLAGYDLSLESFTLKRINDPDIVAIRKVIKARESAQFNAKYPMHYGAAIIVNQTRFTANDAYGDPEWPLDDETIVQKAMTLMQYGKMTKGAAKKLCDKVATLNASEAVLSDFTECLP